MTSERLHIISEQISDFSMSVSIAFILLLQTSGRSIWVYNGQRDQKICDHKYLVIWIMALMESEPVIHNDLHIQCSMHSC